MQPKIKNSDVVTIGNAIIKASCNSEIVDEFINNLGSPSTRLAYSKDLASFAYSVKFFSRPTIDFPLPDLDLRDVTIYKEVMLNEGLSHATINRRMGCLRTFFKWANSKKLNTLINPKLITIEKNAPAEIEDTVSIAEGLSNLGFRPDVTTLKGLCHRLIMLMIYNLGLNRSQIVLIKLSDLEGNGLWVIGRNNIRRFVQIDDETRACIETYRSKFPLLPTDYLIHTDPPYKNAKPMDGSTIYRIIQRYSAGDNSTLSPRTLRAAAIKNKFASGLKPEEVSEFARIKDLASLKPYQG